MWRDDEIGQAAVGLPETDTEPVLTTREQYAPNWLVESADEAARQVAAAGGRVLCAPVDIPVGRLAVVADPFGNTLVLLDLSEGRYITDQADAVIDVAARPATLSAWWFTQDRRMKCLPLRLLSEIPA